ncbi:MAG: ribonuclease R [Eubacterium sp.]|jgi:ribonuclease R|nr:ribonuclease R [Eubacterium sp.]NBI84817.1 ribonuclease R [Lachnospiraceae bacterium]
MDKEQLEKRKKAIYGLICDKMYVPMKIKEMAVLLSVSKSERHELEEVLNDLVADGKVQVSAKGKYSKAKGNLVTGILTGHPRGYGFVETEGQADDIFIPSDQLGGAFHKDTVQVAITPGSSGKRREGKVVKIISHGITQVIGTYESSKNYGFVIPDDSKIGKDIFVPKERSKGAVEGHKVVVGITDYGKAGKNPEGKVLEILGHANDPGTDVASLVKAYEIPVEFPEKVLNQAVRVAKDVSEADMAGRMDLRDLQMVTIDGEDAKDLDDAVSLTREGGVYSLGVHIADVTNYVQEHSALDVEALERGTSVYLVDRVIPMLPHTLSNGICSLNAGENRLALSCIMKIDEKGKVIDHTIAETVIRVDRRMSYTNVRKILQEQDPQAIEEFRELVPMLTQMGELACILRKKRMKRGSIDFDFPETKIQLDAEGHPVEIKPYERNAATRLIEDFMLIANETIAEHFFWQQIPFVYRTHENPDPEKIRKLAMFINNFGYSIHIGTDEIHPKELQKLLQKIEGSDEDTLISRLTLRSMKQAKYSVYGTGHFGLAASYYCHFTSPIRRYPDLQIHRIIKECLRGRMNEKRMEHYEEILPEVAAHASETERRAEELERETDKLKKAEFMSAHIGEEFEGVISGVTAWGLYVELPNTVEGLVHITSLTDDFYEYVEESYELVGKSNNRHYKLGQRVDVTVAAADLLRRTIDFELSGEPR